MVKKAYQELKWVYARIFSSRPSVRGAYTYGPILSDYVQQEVGFILIL